MRMNDVKRRVPFRALRSGGLARVSDRFEALITALFLVIGLLMIGVAFRAGAHTSATTLRHEREWLAASYAADAAITSVREVHAGDGPVARTALVTWTDPVGASHSGKVEPIRAVTVGARLAIRVGGDGNPRLSQPSNAAATGVTAGLWSLLTGWVALGLLSIGLRVLMIRYNCRRWAAEWLRVEPIWTGRQRRS